MANNNSPFGFVPVRRLGGEGSPKLGEYAIASALGSNIALGDLVKFAGDSSQPYGIPLIDLASGVTDVVIGVFGGCEYVDSTGAIQFSKNWISGTVPLAGTKIKALVYDDRQLVFKVQMSLGLAYTDIPNNCNMKTGTATNGVSGQTLDSSLIVTTNTSGFRILKLFQSPDNALGNYAIVECMINRSAFANQIATGT